MIELLKKAGVPENYWVEAQGSLDLAKAKAKGLNLAKWKVRLFKAGKIAKLLDWEDERLSDVREDLWKWDIAPVRNVTAHGDNIPWNENGPVKGAWLNQDPNSEEYKAAVAANYWCKGEHPRSKKSRKAWYRRNGGEAMAYILGEPLPPKAELQVWEANGVKVCRAGGLWIVNYRTWWGWKCRRGFEVDNVFTDSGVIGWVAFEHDQLRAPVTWR